MLSPTSIFWEHFFSKNCSVERDTSGTHLTTFQRLICSVMCKQSRGAHMCKTSKCTACCLVIQYCICVHLSHIIINYCNWDISFWRWKLALTYLWRLIEEHEAEERNIHQRVFMKESWIHSDPVHISTLNYIFNPHAEFFSDQSKWQRH